MALYVSIDEGYEVTRLNGLDSVIRESEPYTLQDGRKLTKKIAQKELKYGYINLYKYEEEEELEQAKENGSVIGVDWKIKILRI